MQKEEDKDNMKSIIFIAPPAAGKGTQSKLLCETYNFNHISTGDLLRDEINGSSEIGQTIKKIIEDGKLVEDSIILELLTNKLNSMDCTNGYILDGFPRNTKQAIAYDEILENINQKIDNVFYLDLPKEIAKERIVGRLSCPNCGNIYNEFIAENKPKNDGVCDNCQSSLVKRKDDNEETFNKRFETYMEETKPLIEYYEQKGILYAIDSSLDKMEIFNQITKIIGNK